MLFLNFIHFHSLCLDFIGCLFFVKSEMYLFLAFYCLNKEITSIFVNREKPILILFATTEEITYVPIKPSWKHPKKHLSRGVSSGRSDRKADGRRWDND